jgi:hypothetical protein
MRTDAFLTKVLPGGIGWSLLLAALMVSPSGAQDTGTHLRGRGAYSDRAAAAQAYKDLSVEVQLWLNMCQSEDPNAYRRAWNDVKPDDQKKLFQKVEGADTDTKERICKEPKSFLETGAAK